MATHVDWEKRLGDNVRRLRKQACMSQEDLADCAGIDVRYLGGIERAQENPSLKVLVSIAGCLKVQPHILLTALEDGDDGEA